MAIINPFELTMGQSISFKSINIYDNVLYTGTIIGIVKYDIAKDYTDLVPYYTAVKKSMHSMASIDRLTYMLLRQYQSEKVGLTVLALEWIEQTSLKIVELVKYFDVRIYDRNLIEATDVIDILNTHDYKCALVPN